MMFLKLLKIASIAILSAASIMGRADDTDLFTLPSAATPPAPNILFVLDNTANWDRASQQWVGSPKQGNAELLAIKNFVAGLTKPANVGLMEYTTTGHTGGYLRYGIRDMTVSANNQALQNIVNGITVTGSSEKVNASSGNIANTFYEAWLYLNGSSSWAGMDGNADYAGNTGLTAAGQSLLTGFPYKSSAANAGYNSPLSANCAKTYIIFIGNNGPNASPAAPATTDPSVTTLTQYKYTSQPDIQSAWARFLHLRPDLAAGSTAAAQGSVTTYTIDAYNLQQTLSYTTILKNMALNGGGKYYQAGSDTALSAALQNILTEIQAVNSVFASASLPVSVSVRGTYLNQVYLGVFRPDSLAAPNWTGNLKQYKLAVDTTVTPPNVFLADSLGVAAENQNTGFVSPSATSYWTQASTFWNPSYYVNSQGAGGSSDSPDGDLVEKGGAAQYVRTTFATSQTARNVYTCTAPCVAGAALASTPFNTTNTAITTAALGAASTAEHDAIINWVRGGNVNLDDPLDTGSPQTFSPTNIRGFHHGDVLHSRPAVINYARNADDIVVFYGSNDGMVHAVKGGQTSTNGDGGELWAFIAPDHYTQFKRLRDHTPVISSANPKPYFFDGSATVYTSSTYTDGKIDYTRGDKAYLYVTMRRGGRIMYALDVSNPLAPTILWKRSSSDTGFSELGQTWSDMRVAKLRFQTNPVLVFGMGYDAAANDPTVQGTATLGHGVMMLDAISGALLWQAGPAAANAAASYYTQVAGMTYAIPANVATYDSDLDGKIDRLYAADTGGNVWRINVQDTNPALWTVTQLASLGGSNANARKFLYPADIVPATTKVSFDAILIGSGDREHPFDTAITNQYYMIKDAHALTATRSTPITVGTAGATLGYSGQLFDATADLIQTGTPAQQAAASTALNTASGWYVTLGTGEKVVGGSTTLAGTVFFGTNAPTTASSTTCTGNLGVARIYAMNYLDGSATIDVNQNGSFTQNDRFLVRAGGGFPPTPVPISVVIDGKTYQAAISGTKVLSPPAAPLGRRYRTFWQKKID